jgi:two-component system, OmpR family, response regulator
LIDAVAAADLEPSDWSLPASPARRILVVDDNVDAARSLAMLLDAKGHRVRTVHDAAAALQAVESFSPEVVLLDIELPEMSGYEVAKRIRAMGDRAADILLVATTGRGQSEDRAAALEAGFDGHLTKPVDLSLLSTLLRRGSSDDEG